MSAGRTTRIERAILAVLQPMTGLRSSGSLFVRATGDPVTLCRNNFAVPIGKSRGTTYQLDFQKLLRTDSETIEVTSAGAIVPVTSNLGGLQMNLDAGIEVRWEPALLGLEPVSVVQTVMTGGADATGPGSIKRLVTYEGIGAASSAKDLFLAKGNLFPSAVLSWDSSEPGELRGRGVISQHDRWTLAVVSSRGDGGEQRRAEGMGILDLAEEYLLDRGAVDGEVFSAPHIEIVSRSRLAVTPTSYIYTMVFDTVTTVSRLDARTFAEWTKTKYDMRTQTMPPFPVVDSAIYSMGPAFGDAFSDAFAHVPAGQGVSDG